MATEKSEPRVGIIVGFAVLSIVTLLTLRGLLISYFNIQTHDEEQAKFLGVAPEQLHRQRESERERLENGAVPITQAMGVMVQGTARPANIEPRPSVDMAPMQGWMQRPTGYVPPPGTVPAAAPTTPAPAPTEAPAPMQGGPSAPAAATPTTTAAPSPAPTTQTQQPAPSGAAEH